MRIELNLPALERLIGDDKDMEFCIKKQIIHEFSKRHLKEIADSESCALAAKEIKEYVNKIAREAFDIENLVNQRGLRAEVGDRLRSIIQSLVNDKAQEVINDILIKKIEEQKKYWEREIHKAVEKAINHQIAIEVEEGIRKRLDAAKNIVT